MCLSDWAKFVAVTKTDPNRFFPSSPISLKIFRLQEINSSNIIIIVFLVDYTTFHLQRILSAALNALKLDGMRFFKMMRLQTYATLSLVATLAVVYHAFHSRGQYYPAMVHLSTSKISLVLLLNMGLVIMCILWQLTKKLFLGSLREAEVERLNEQAWREVMEILFAITIFRQDFSVSFLAMVTTLLLIKALHWLAQKRVEYIETTPSVPTLSHIRIVSFMGFLLVLDSLFLYSSVRHLIETRQASVSLFFSFEYMILATTTVAIFVKYVFYVSDMIMEGQWERKAVYTFYLELIRDLLHLSMNYGVPLHLIRELYETFRNFKVRVADYIRYRKITSNMNDRFPDATSEELNASDATCIICREEMTTAKKLICGHLFHVHCLRSWLERQHTCPTCRALVVPQEGGETAAVGQRGTLSNTNQPASASSSSQASSSGTAAIDNLSANQARLEAAAAAASIYEKSFVSPGYAMMPQAYGGSPNSTSLGSNVGPIEQQQHQHSSTSCGLNNLPFPQFSQSYFPPIYRPGGNITFGEGSSPVMTDLQIDLQQKVLEHQIEVLRSQLMQLQRAKGDETLPLDNKGKAVVSSSSSLGGEPRVEEKYLCCSKHFRQTSSSNGRVMIIAMLDDFASFVADVRINEQNLEYRDRVLIFYLSITEAETNWKSSDPKVILRSVV
ncbi:ERAD-associated E3 ubiquitin-protein ligase HRD1A-like protein [Drosera capensis]